MKSVKPLTLIIVGLWPVTLVIPDLSVRTIDWQLGKVCPETMALSVVVREQTSLGGEAGEIRTNSRFGGA